MKYLRWLTLSIAVILVPLRGANPNSGSKACPSSGNVALSTTSLKFATGAVQGAQGASGRIYIGSSAVTTSSGIYVTAGTVFQFEPLGNSPSYDLANTYIACTNSADTLTWTVW